MTNEERTVRRTDKSTRHSRLNQQLKFGVEVEFEAPGVWVCEFEVFEDLTDERIERLMGWVTVYCVLCKFSRLSRILSREVWQHIIHLIAETTEGVLVPVTQILNLGYKLPKEMQRKPVWHYAPMHRRLKKLLKRESGREGWHHILTLLHPCWYHPLLLSPKTFLPTGCTASTLRFLPVPSLMEPQGLHWKKFMRSDKNGNDKGCCRCPWLCMHW